MNLGQPREIIRAFPVPNMRESHLHSSSFSGISLKIVQLKFQCVPQFQWEFSLNFLVPSREFWRKNQRSFFILRQSLFQQQTWFVGNTGNGIKLALEQWAYRNVLRECINKWKLITNWSNFWGSSNEQVELNSLTQFQRENFQIVSSTLESLAVFEPV